MPRNASPIRKKNNSPRLHSGAPQIMMLSDPDRGGRRDVLLDGGLEVVSWKGVAAQDKLLIEAAAEAKCERAVAAMTSSALPALALKTALPSAHVSYFHIDLFNIASARNLLARNNAAGRIETICEPVIPFAGAEVRPDLFLASMRSDDEAGLSLELLHQVHHRLAPGGRLLVASDNPRDRWLGDKLQKIFGNLTRHARDKRALVYSVKQKEAPPAELTPDDLIREQFIQKVVVDDRGTGLEFETCYGLFASHQLDTGSGALLDVLDPPAPCRAALDLGCGWGGLGILAARRAGARELVMIDANARAVQMSRRNAESHFPAADVRLEANCESIFGSEADAGRFDLVVSNPPYGSELRTAEMFVRAAHRALRPGGMMVMVAKKNERLADAIESEFGAFDEGKRWGYQILTARKAS